VGDDMMLGHGAPAAVPDLRWFLIDFLPIERRRLRCDGVSLHSIRYWSDVLRSGSGIASARSCATICAI
jgi:putative transposase